MAAVQRGQRASSWEVCPRWKDSVERSRVSPHESPRSWGEAGSKAMLLLGDVQGRSPSAHPCVPPTPYPSSFWLPPWYGTLGTKGGGDVRGEKPARTEQQDAEWGDTMTVAVADGATWSKRLSSATNYSLYGWAEAVAGISARFTIIFQVLFSFAFTASIFGKFFFQGLLWCVKHRYDAIIVFPLSQYIPSKTRHDMELS